MRLIGVGCNFRQTPIALRERLGFDEQGVAAALVHLAKRFGCECCLLSTCNRVEVYLGTVREGRLPDQKTLVGFLAAERSVPEETVAPYAYGHTGEEAVGHLFRVASGLDSLVIGEGQIRSQVRRSYELARRAGVAGALMHQLFQHVNAVVRRVRSETGLCRGRASVAGVAVEYVRQVFEHFSDKTILVLGAGKMGRLTLRDLCRLGAGRVLIANRSLEKAQALAGECGGSALPWDALDEGLIAADIILSTTGATEPVVTRAHWDAVRDQRAGRPAVVLDIAVPRDFEPSIHDGETTWVFNVDDLARVREHTLRARLRHVAAAEAIIHEERTRFAAKFAQRQNGPLIAQLQQDLEAKRLAIESQLIGRLNGRLSEADRAAIEGAFRLLQNQFLHGPIRALAEEPAEGARHTLREALRKLFRLSD